MFQEVGMKYHQECWGIVIVNITMASLKLSLSLNNDIITLGLFLGWEVGGGGKLHPSPPLLSSK